MKTRITLLLLLIDLSITCCNAQERKSAEPVVRDAYDIKNGSYYLPQQLPRRKYSHIFSLYYVIVPVDWAHDIVQAPMFNYSGKYTLPSGFNLQAGLSTLVISNRVNVGPFWNCSIDNYHFAIGYQVAFNYGVLKQFGFDTILTGWEQQPSLTLGYSFKKSAVIMRGDLYYTSTLNLSEAGHVTSLENSFLNGYSVTTSFEERLFSNKVFSLGLNLNYLHYHIIAWPAFPVNKYRYIVPEFQFGIKF